MLLSMLALLCGTTGRSWLTSLTSLDRCRPMDQACANQQLLQQQYCTGTVAVCDSAIPASQRIPYARQLSTFGSKLWCIGCCCLHCRLGWTTTLQIWRCFNASTAGVSSNSRCAVHSFPTCSTFALHRYATAQLSKHFAAVVRQAGSWWHSCCSNSVALQQQCSSNASHVH
jgi:hypothetical protein